MFEEFSYHATFRAEVLNANHAISYMPLQSRRLTRNVRSRGCTAFSTSSREIVASSHIIDPLANGVRGIKFANQGLYRQSPLLLGGAEDAHLGDLAPDSSGVHELFLSLSLLLCQQNAILGRVERGVRQSRLPRKVAELGG